MLMCPNCDKEMKDESFWYCSISDWDMDYPGTFHEEYRCPACCIKYTNREWIIPEKFERATDKQIRCVKFINRELGTRYEPLLKNKTWKFIHDNLDDARQSRDVNFTLWCEENADWLPEYF